MQKFERQQVEDGPDPASKYGPDRTAYDQVDPDGEDTISVPLARRGPSKHSAPPLKRDTFPQGPAVDDDDCVILKVHNVAPLSFAYPLPSVSVDSGAQAAAFATSSRKRSAASTSDSRAAERAAKKSKAAKKPAEKSTRRRPTANA